MMAHVEPYKVFVKVCSAGVSYTFYNPLIVKVYANALAIYWSHRTCCS